MKNRITFWRPLIFNFYWVNLGARMHLNNIHIVTLNNIITQTFQAGAFNINLFL